MHIVVRGEKRLFQETEVVVRALIVLHKRSLLRWLLAVVFDWMVIGLLICAATAAQSVVGLLICALFVAGRQHALIVLMHEGAHHNVLKNNRENYLLADILTAWPMLLSTKRYRENHIEHHRLTNRPDDPDLKRKIGKAGWQFPVSLAEFCEGLGRYLLAAPKDQIAMAMHVGILLKVWRAPIMLLASGLALVAP